MTKPIKRPNSARHLDMAIRRFVANRDNPELAFVEVRDLMANTIVTQLMPEGVIKGGCSLKIRYGIDNTRYTTDLDISHISELNEFVEKFQENLSKGVWGFTGRLIKKNPAHPKDVPFQYVMKPFEVKLGYCGRPWCTVIFETGQNEIGNAEEFEKWHSKELCNLFNNLGFDTPDDFQLMILPYQVAQKLHGLTEVNSMRIHDLIDLQLILNNSFVDLNETKEICEKLFKYRKLQPWPPKIQLDDKCQELYLEKAKGLNVIEDYDDAILWLKDLINKIANSQ